MDIQFQLAQSEDQDAIWKMLQQGIERRKKEESNQWQDGYPNEEVVKKDIEQSRGFIILGDKSPIGYIVIAVNDEPEYKNIKGNWLTHDDYVVFHRLVFDDDYIGKGFLENVFLRVEDWAREKGIKSIKADTNFDNQPMLHMFHKRGYFYCGEVTFRESPRKAFEKIIKT